jgi:glycosyltransferase involved in cell wall biosynthesis
VTRTRTATAGAALVVIAASQARRHHSEAARRAAAAAIRAAAVDGALAGERASEFGSDQPLVAVVMAAYNESSCVGSVLAALPVTVCSLPVCPIVVDDGSTDETAEQARSNGALVGTHRRNLGQGDALRTGFAIAKRLGAQVVVTIDADGQHDPAELPALVGPVVAGEVDYVQGSRFLGRYDDAGGARDLGIRGFTRLIKLLAGTEITDCTNGFRAIDGMALARLRLVEDRFSAPEILIQAAGRGLRMREVPVHIRSRETGSSKKPRGVAYASGYLGAILRSWARVYGSRSAVREVA